MSAKIILAATIAIAAAALAISSANAMTGRAAIDRCIDIGADAGTVSRRVGTAETGIRPKSIGCHVSAIV